ncbi:MAG: Rrf2 family transcriptional regulator [Candidatus Cloacimonetes bacterium]|jgi:Rrf2 family protein|nr:Rrf2 family transcriptional regulator [Candidatus Cloacimonadota bacterium]
MSNLINISEAASLALHGLVLIAKNQPLRMNVKVLAEELNASQTHLAKVFQNLSKAGLVRSLRGPSGGFELNKSAEDITFLEIYEIIDSKIMLGECPLGKNHCVFQSCIFDNELNRISTDIYDTFKKMKLSDF